MSDEKDQLLETFSEELVYNLSKVGSFGRFKTGDSFPVEYVMTTFSPNELYQHLTFARELESADLDFELLMQRDIDEDRVRTEMEPYLNRSNRASQKHDVVFFPPLLVAIVPVEQERMLDYYEKSEIKKADFVIREWEPFFSLRFVSSSNPDATTVQDGDDVYRILRDPVKISLRIAGGDEKGSRLVVIDGQHRLLAIRRVYESNKSLLRELSIPVCIVFPPESTRVNVEKAKPALVQKVPQVFRRLFVDVNETMEKVGGHFTILLSDDTIPSLASRQFCDYVLQKSGREGLAAVEWNIRSRKNSYDLNRPYSLTSVGLITKSLELVFKNQAARLEYVLNLPEVHEELHPEDQDADDYPRSIKFDNFSISQKPVLEKQIDRYLSPAIWRLVFEIEAHKKKLGVFDKALGDLISVRAKATPGTDESKNAKKVLGQILDYRPILQSDDEGLAARSHFFGIIKKGKEEVCADVIDRALFHRCIFDVWAVLVDEGRALELPVSSTVDACVTLFDAALIDRGRNFSFTQEYMQHSVYMNGRIKAKEDTRKALGKLVLANLGRKATASAVAEKLASGMDVNQEELEDKLREIGINAAIAFGKHYEKERTRQFKKGYLVDPSLDKDDRDTLQRLEKIHKAEFEEYRAGKRRKEDVSTEFDSLVSEHVSKDVERAMTGLADRLDLGVDILVTDDSDFEEDETE